MDIVVIASGAQQQTFLDKQIPANVKVKLITEIGSISDSADAFFYLLDESTIVDNSTAILNLGNIVFINSINTTLADLPQNCVRINGWPGFFAGKSIEVATADCNKAKAEQVLNLLGWTFHYVPDIIGFIAPRTIAMIINEAYFALTDEVSSKAEIDIAMKLGTGYPYGPFEWSEQIGLANILHLLETLAIEDERYTPAPLLKQSVA